MPPGDFEFETVRAEYKRYRHGAFAFFDLEIDQATNIITLWSLAVWMGYFLTKLGSRDTYMTDHEIPVFTGHTRKSLMHMLSLIPVDNVYLFAFNGIKFDHLYLFDGCIATRYSQLNSLKYVVLELYNKTFYLKDLLSYITVCTLESLGKQVKCPKLKTGDKATDMVYCVRDTVILVKGWFEIVLPGYEPIVDKLTNVREGVIMFNSQAQIAFNIMIWNVGNLYSVPEPLHGYLRNCYYGAKVDSSMYGKHYVGRFAAYDLRSMYPAAFSNKMPCGKLKYVGTLKFKWEGFNPFKWKPFIATVLVEKKFVSIFDQSYGIIPIRTKNGLMYVSTGKFQGMFTSIDIWNLIEDGWTILNIKHIYMFDKWTLDIAEAVTFWFTEKQSNVDNPLLYWFVKQILTSWIGYASLVYNPAPLTWFAMSYARRQLLILKKRLNEHGCLIVFYGDTDSIFVDEACMDKVLAAYPEMLDNVLGDMNNITGEVEYRGNELIVLGKKAMWSDVGKVSCKGHPRLDKEAFVKALHDKYVSESNSPVRTVKINEDTRVIHCECSPFIKTHRTLQTTVPAYKQLYKKIYLNKHIVQYTCVCFLQYLRNVFSATIDMPDSSQLISVKFTPLVMKCYCTGVYCKGAPTYVF